MAAAARSVLRSSSVRSAASRISAASKPNASSAPRSTFRIPAQKPLSNRIFRSPVEMSCVSVESMQPFHTATASALLTSMLSAPRTCGWTLEDLNDDVCDWVSFGMKNYHVSVRFSFG
ncbi:hypothetical protein QVD17_20087 [Tagetes erecta]|uniref:Protein NUCLEAR FUSION DEFECTIVE 6, chloroplastic/mitochondrial-like n=1 Tax=Tagetes erecta TaxID=13708 RepID=A0AAD8KL31_TARER|nr:hypothetical protein QVD17_20087 [Tagetes erecta]